MYQKTSFMLHGDVVSRKTGKKMSQPNRNDFQVGWMAGEAQCYCILPSGKDKIKWKQTSRGRQSKVTQCSISHSIPPGETVPE